MSRSVQPVPAAGAADHVASALAAGKSRWRWEERKYQIYPVLAVVAVLVAWELLVVIKGLRPIYLPKPSAIAYRMYLLTVDGTFLRESAVTLMRIVGGFFLGAIPALLLGLFMGMSRTVESIADLFIAALYPLPKVALIPLLIIWLGSGESSKLAISAISAFFPVVINTFQGIRQIDQGLIKAAKNLGANTRQLQRKVIVPAALPYILAGFRLGMGVSFILVVAAEMVASKSGLGYVLFYSGQILRTDTVFATLIVLAILGGAMTKFQQYLDRKIAPWAFTNN